MSQSYCCISIDLWEYLSRDINLSKQMWKFWLTRNNFRLRYLRRVWLKVFLCWPASRVLIFNASTMHWQWVSTMLHDEAWTLQREYHYKIFLKRLCVMTIVHGGFRSLWDTKNKSTLHWHMHDAQQFCM